MQTDISKYPLGIRILHWLMALIIICLLAVGLIMANMKPDDSLRPLLFSLHKSFGLTILLLFACRLSLRATSDLPALPREIPQVERVLATLGHWGFYVFMLAMPVSGYISTAGRGFPVRFFGFTLPKIMEVNRSLAEQADMFHQYAAYALILLIALHVTGALKHCLLEHINLFRRMI